ncbi:glycosyltransferase family 2 protein [Embleya scabrispora]|uniref:glycosyltransferase family 2 protein n=1 Tax=Embleya scabrispora TaxID=159449 RepID=UPI0005926B8C|nr:glycosyltransferase family A protein [Embleya scabrispora]MYS79944.1 glycosyltransferase [Streptomyces sp. SID5474]
MAAKDAVSVVVITYNDAVHLPDAIESALAQGEIVHEVVVVDDASTDDTPQVLGRWPRDRVRVVRRTVNSGGCGAPRNDGTAFARAPWVLYLDSDDVLPPGAVQKLLAAAEAADADFAVGACVRHELPENRDVPWQRELFTNRGVYSLALRPETLWDTLAVNKLYRRSFLTANKIQFPDGDEHYEDFVFTADVYAAATRFAVIPDHVYTWNVRRRSAAPSISLRRDQLKNWQDRLKAHTHVLKTMRATGETRLVDAAERKFVEHDLALYLRDLHTKDADYQQQWWDATRAHLDTFGYRGIETANAPMRWISALIALRGQPTALPRLAELAAEPARLVPPYAGTPNRPLWDDEEPSVPLTGLTTESPDRLPINIEAAVTMSGPRLALVLRVADLYGLLSRAGAVGADIILRDRHGRAERRRAAQLETVARDGFLHGKATLEGGTLRGLEAFATWDIWARISFRDGTFREVRVRAGGGSGLGRHLVPDLRRGVLLVQPYRTSSHSLGVRVADGPRGAAAVASARMKRRKAPGKKS